MTGSDLAFWQQWLLIFTSGGGFLQELQLVLINGTSYFLASLSLITSVPLEERHSSFCTSEGGQLVVALQ